MIISMKCGDVTIKTTTVRHLGFPYFENFHIWPHYWQADFASLAQWWNLMREGKMFIKINTKIAWRASRAVLNDEYW